MPRVATLRKAKNQPQKIPGFLATPERMRQQGGVVDDCFVECNRVGATLIRHKARSECKLDGYFLSGKIDKGEHAAGMKFRSAWLTKVHGIKTHDSTQPTFGGGDAGSAIERLTISERVLKQAYAQLEAHQSLIVVKVCGADEFAGGRDKLISLRSALDQLARLWGFV